MGVDSTEAGPGPDEAAIAADLVRRIAAGETAAEGQLVERYRRGLRYLLHRLGALPDLADDVQQETFRIVIERLRHEGLADPAGLAPFLRGTARNLLIAERRKTARRRTWGDTGELAQAVAPAPSQLQSVLLDEEAEMVRRLIGELPTDRDRQLLLRFYVGEEDKDSICADLGLESLHFNRVLFRARQRFKELLERFQKQQVPVKEGR
ncbi:MAG: sigma-70 family RNA polymerase sigma factor [Acidobacteria bacterium]|nr:sigma-70 family RNA polymerase sigma factor [Acidobacteriota bacterium]